MNSNKEEPANQILIYDEDGEFASNETDPEVRAHMRIELTYMEENEHIYRERAKELLETHFLRQEFGQIVVKYKITDGYFHFRASGNGGMDFFPYFMGSVNGTTEEKIRSLISMFAHAERELFTIFGIRVTNP